MRILRLVAVDSISVPFISVHIAYKTAEWELQFMLFLYSSFNTFSTY